MLSLVLVSCFIRRLEVYPLRDFLATLGQALQNEAEGIVLVVRVDLPPDLRNKRGAE